MHWFTSHSAACSDAKLLIWHLYQRVLGNNVKVLTLFVFDGEAANCDVAQAVNLMSSSSDVCRRHSETVKQCTVCMTGALLDEFPVMPSTGICVVSCLHTSCDCHMPLTTACC